MRGLGLRASFQKKLLGSFLAVGLVPLVVCVGLILGIFQTVLLRNSRESAQNQLDALSSDFERLLTDCGGVLESLQKETLIVDAMTGRRRFNGTQVYNALYSAALPLLREADFSLYDAQGELLYATSNAAPRSLPTNWGALAAAGEAMETVYRQISPLDPTGGCMRMARAVPGRDGAAGYVVAELREEHFQRLFQGGYGTGSDVLVLDPFWDQVYATPTLQDSALAARLRLCLLDGQSLGEAGADYTYHVFREKSSGFSVLLRQPKPLTDGTMRLFCLVAALSILLCAGVCMRVALGFSRQLFEPIRTLNSAMAAVEEGDLDARVEVTGTDEISQLSGRFNRMTQRLKANLAQSIHQQQELGDAQIRMMQAQLNPHFLYNTLDTLKWLGKINGSQEISTISADLADILRRSISAEEFVELREELEVLERYVEIQAIRFPGKFEFALRVEPVLMDALVPKLMLQPLVENAIIHGFEDGSSGHISVEAVQSGETMLLTVRDDGCGMSEESMARFLRRSGPQEGGHLGLYNVDAILRLHYGPDSGLQFLPPAGGRGTCIRVALPIAHRKGENSDDEGSGG